MAARLTLRPDITASPRPLRSRAQKPKRGAIIIRVYRYVDNHYQRVDENQAKWSGPNHLANGFGEGDDKGRAAVPTL